MNKEEYTEEFLEPIENLCNSSIELIQYAKGLAVKQVNIIQIMAYYTLGKWIVEEQQKGEKRAQYGKTILKRLSEVLTAKFGRGFSVDNLENIRKFYLVYQNRISETMFRKFAIDKSKTLPQILGKEKIPFSLSWSHYIKLSHIKNDDERKFYEIEASQNNWSLAELKRQYNSALYERLLLSTEKEKVKQVIDKGKVYEKPEDAVKDPYVLEFLGLDEKSNYTESDLEKRIIDNLQKFLLELGKGFTFVDRQKRFTFDEEHFRVDLVFYNRLLRCFVLFDLKIGKLKHQDLGQMQMYVNYYDRYEKQVFENPTIGILLCQEKNNALVELTLPEGSNIFASEYQLYLPDKKILQQKLKEWIDEETGDESE